MHFDLTAHEFTLTHIETDLNYCPLFKGNIMFHPPSLNSFKKWSSANNSQKRVNYNSYHEKMKNINPFF